VVTFARREGCKGKARDSVHEPAPHADASVFDERERTYAPDADGSFHGDDGHVAQATHADPNTLLATFASREGDHLMLPGVRRCTPMKRPHAVPQA